MNYFNKILDKYGLNFDEAIILIVSVCVFLPYYVLLVVLNIVFFYLLASGKIVSTIKSNKNYKSVFLFFIFIMVNSIFNNNLYGVGVSIVIFQLMLFFMYYRSVINRKLFANVINVYMIVSVVCFAMTILSVLYQKIVGGMKFYDFVEYMSLHRPISSFFNTNYYATICEFIIIIAMYYFLSNKNKGNRLYFLVISSMAFVVLFLTENRTALPTIFVATLVLSFTKQNKKVFAFIGVFAVVIAFLMVYSNKFFPRYEFLGNSFDTRIHIWENSFKLLKSNFLFGYGPMAYQNAMFSEYPANHAHNILLDLLINFGVIGVLIIMPVFWSLCKIIYRCREKNMFRLITALTCIVVLHGMFDVTIFWHQTAFIYFSVLFAVGKVNGFDSKFIFSR